jgi:hypothetical protein
MVGTRWSRVPHEPYGVVSSGEADAVERAFPTGCREICGFEADSQTKKEELGKTKLLQCVFLTTLPKSRAVED